MALRSPTPFHNFWGTANPTTNAVWTSGTLPNEGGAPPSYGSPNVEIGDFAYVTGDSTFYVCTAAGSSTLGGATWVQITTGAAGVDRFAPKHLVGNRNSGDPATDFSANGFYYWADDGSGNGIRSALIAASPLGGNIPGDVWIRPGAYNLAAEDTPLTIPANTRVQGAGATTVINKFTADAQSIFTVFELQDKAELRDLSIVHILNDAAPYVFTGLGAIEVVLTPSGESSLPSSAHVERVAVSISDNLTFANWVTGFYVPATCSLEADRCEVTLSGTGIPEAGNNILSGWRAVLATLTLDDCRSSGGDAAVQSASSSVSIDQCSFDNFSFVGVLAAAGDLAVTGATKLSSFQIGSVTGISAAEQGTLLVNARITLTNELNGAQVGISADVDSGQIFGSRIEASSGIISANATGRGVAIGFNSVISQAGQQISSQVVDEVAHNILST